MSGEEKNEEQLVLELLRNLKTDNDKDHTEIKGLLISQNGRIRKLENWRIWITALAVGVGLASGLTGDALIKFLTGN